MTCSSKRVSIHAPLRGATSAQFGTWPRIRSFNPRTPAGCDYFFCVFPSAAWRFNPRTPAGCDDSEPESGSRCSGFNPRTPAGCDSQAARCDKCLAGFNPRTPAGCDCRGSKYALHRFITRALCEPGFVAAAKAGRFPRKPSKCARQAECEPP